MRKKKKHEDVPKKDADVDKNKSNETEKDVKVEGKSLKFLSFREMMRGLSPHPRLLKDQLRDKTVPYMDLLRPGPPIMESSKKYAKQK